MLDAIKKHKLAALVNPDSSRAEMFRVLRTNIQFADTEREHKIVAVTSAKPREGKTITIGNLAVMFASSDKRTLLVDANLRRPALHRLFSASNSVGLSDVLAGHCPAEQAIQPTRVPKLDLLTSGRAISSPAERLGSEQMLETLEWLRGCYDFVLVDTSCMLEVTDSQLLSAFCDGVVLVVRSGKVKQREALQAMNKLDRVRAKVLGIVLNHA